MKHSHYLFLIVLLLSACNSYDHESYIAQFRTDFDNDINNYRVSAKDSIRILNTNKQSFQEFRTEKIANDRFYIDNYSWYQLGKNLMLSPAEAKVEANKYGFVRPYYFLEFLKSDTTKGPVKKQVMDDVRNRLYDKHGKDSVQIYGCTAKDLFNAVKRHEKRKYFFFLKVDFEKVKNASDKQKKVAAQMMSGALNRLKEKVEVKDKRYYLTISKGEEIGISENLFTVGKNIYIKMNDHLDSLEVTNPEFVEKVELGTHNSKFRINKWEDALKMYEYYIDK
ncbi:hypothetical protein [Marinifilum sp. D737]|uniref:hypothetical protein n=1 Tax=Marinifilum sp. D737 TaxID=2969628 RepID=UPI002275C9AF|nr:hypothetical protein [Marinifilum sp. D737]MCY1636448.1 hypothetical protein [Marinifilum sp. D737]